MSLFEDQLKRGMTRQNPGPDFTARVLRRLEKPEARSMKVSWRERLSLTHSWRLAPVLAALLMMTGGLIYHEHERAVQEERTAQGEAAKRKLLVAMQIAGAKLEKARHRIFEIEGAERQQ
jgi:hypothetical protein